LVWSRIVPQSNGRGEKGVSISPKPATDYAFEFLSSKPVKTWELLIVIGNFFL